MQSERIQKELFKNISLSGCRITASAFVQAKAKLKPDIFRYIFDQLNMNLTSLKLYNDEYRLFAIDGSDFNQYGILNLKISSILKAPIANPTARFILTPCTILKIRPIKIV